MKDDSTRVVTILGIIESIIFDSQELMNNLLEEGRTPKEGGGFILKYDPNHTSLKEALKILVFVGAAMESMWHQKAVELRSKNFAEKADRECKSVPLKFECIGLTESSLLEDMTNYYNVRRQIVHEKAHESKFQKTLFVAESEANKAVELFKSVKSALRQLNG
jgi:hypothetical protein